MKNKMSTIIPTVFATNKKDFDERLNKLVKISKDIQIDIMDGSFVKAKSISIKEIPNLRKYKCNFEAHLMTNNPENLLSDLKEKGFKKVIFHFEAVPDIEKARRIVFLIKEKKMKPWIVFSITTSFGHIINTIHTIQELGGIMLMGHVPGIEHTDIDQNIMRKIEHIRTLDKKIKIQIDGGVNPGNIKKLAQLGVDYFSIGSFISESVNPKEAMNELETSLK
jgi:ribulose-phosphate 3-epimerase